MKFLIYLLTFAILSISFITCEDVVPLKVSQSEISSSTIKKPQASTDQDNCSPLCTCNCCGQPLIIDNVFSIIATLKKCIVKNELSRYNNQFISNYVQNIWQPPKLSNSYIG